MKRKFTNDEVFVEHSIYARHNLKERLIREKLIPYECIECKNTGSWNGRPLVLQLEHKNGVANDNRLWNLAFICPNCHTQTETYAGKNSRGMRVTETPKQDWRAEKHRRDQAKWKEIKGDPAIRFGEWGWKTRLGLLLNISPNKVEKWLARVTNGSLA